MSRHRVDCWFFDLDVPAGERQALEATLSDDERVRAARYGDTLVARRWVTARGRLRSILARYGAVAPGELRFEYTGPGKPSLAGDPGRWQFNLSHSAHRAVVAVTQSGPVGVDIESRRDLPDRDRIVERFFSTAERAEFRRRSGDAATAAFFRGWTRKEAVLKGLGTGVFGGLERFSVSLDAGEPGPPTFHGDPPAIDVWQLFDLTTGPGFVAALALAAVGPVDIVRRRVGQDPR